MLSDSLDVDVVPDWRHLLQHPCQKHDTEDLLPLLRLMMFQTRFLFLYLGLGIFQHPSI
jgi:hypothetical protein